MKKCICTILIISLLLYLAGCAPGSYVFSEMSLDELKNYKGNEEIIIRTEKEEFIISKEVDAKYETNYTTGDSSIKIIKNEIFRNNIRVPVDSTEISYKDIKSVMIKKGKELETFTLGQELAIITVGLVYTGVLIYALVKGIENSFDFWD